MKRIVHITSVHSPFDSRILYRECRSLANSGYEVFFIAPADFSEKNIDNVRVIGVKKHVKRFKRFFTWFRILIKIYKLDPDLVHFHDPELLIIVPLIRLFKKDRVKIVYDVHEYFIESIKDKFWIPSRLKNITAFFASRLEYFLGQWVDAQVFVVPGQLPYYADWKTIKIIIHNYPDPDEFGMEPGKRGGNLRENFTLVYIGSLYERRGIMTMLKALRLLIKEHYNVRLILGGVFESHSFKSRVEDFIYENNLKANVNIQGWIDYPNLNKYFAMADAAWIALYPTTQYLHDNISTKQLETMGACLPVVCSDIPSLRRFIDEAACGIAVSAKDPAAHASAIKFLYNNPEEAKKMGLRGRQLILEKFNWKIESERFNCFYKNLLQ